MEKPVLYIAITHEFLFCMLY